MKTRAGRALGAPVLIIGRDSALRWPDEPAARPCHKKTPQK
jgi:hypothetical protein